MNIITDEKKIDAILARSVDTIYPSTDALKALLMKGTPLRIYVGIDPTATYVHLGHATNYLLLKRFHELGHKIIVLIGDFTAMIGDPSDKKAARTQLTKEQVQENLKTFKAQIGKILNFEDTQNPIEFQFNADWLAPLTFQDVVELASHFTVQRMLERDVFERRIKEEKPLYVHEFFYPLMQGYDSVALNADLEIGGTDQTFNMLAGRTLVKAYQNREKLVLTTTLLENPLTGEKLMSKSLGTGIALNEPPIDMFGKVMTLPDEAIIQCFIDCTDIDMAHIETLKKQLADGANPRDIKAQLGFALVKMYHSEDEAIAAQEHFDRVFKDKQRPDEIATLVPTAFDIVSVLIEAGFSSSKSDARRQVEQGAVKVNDMVITDINYQVEPGNIIQKGKRFFVQISRNDS